MNNKFNTIYNILFEQQELYTEQSNNNDNNNNNIDKNNPEYKRRLKILSSKIKIDANNEQNYEIFLDECYKNNIFISQVILTKENLNTAIDKYKEICNEQNSFKKFLELSQKTENGVGKGQYLLQFLCDGNNNSKQSDKKGLNRRGFDLIYHDKKYEIKETKNDKINDIKLGVDGFVFKFNAVPKFLTLLNKITSFFDEIKFFENNNNENEEKEKNLFKSMVKTTDLTFKENSFEKLKTIIKKIGEGGISLTSKNFLQENFPILINIFKNIKSNNFKYAKIIGDDTIYILLLDKKGRERKITNKDGKSYLEVSDLDQSTAKQLILNIDNIVQQYNELKGILNIKDDKDIINSMFNYISNYISNNINEIIVVYGKANNFTVKGIFNAVQVQSISQGRVVVKPI